MSGDWDEDLCKKALVLVEELCFNSPRDYSQSERCQEFSYLLRGRNRQLDSGEAPAADRPTTPGAGSNPASQILTSKREKVRAFTSQP